MLGQPPPFLRLRRDNEVQNISGQKAKRAVIVLGSSLVIASGFHRLVTVRQPALMHSGRRTGHLIPALAQQCRLDGVFEGAFRNYVIHRAPLAVVSTSGSS